jgi:hypothetical protein
VIACFVLDQVIAVTCWQNDPAWWWVSVHPCSVAPPRSRIPCRALTAGNRQPWGRGEQFAKRHSSLDRDQAVSRSERVRQGGSCRWPPPVFKGRRRRPAIAGRG